MNWIYMTQTGEKWRVFVYTVMELGIPQNSAILFTGCEPIIFSKLLCFLVVVPFHEVSKNMSYKKELMNCSIIGSFQTSL